MDDSEGRDCDVVIVGCGVAGLYAALNLPASTRILMLSKGSVEECDSMLAQGGICVLANDADYDAFLEDTLVAGHQENDPTSVKVMISASRRVLNDLMDIGVAFETNARGELAFTREGAHSRPRIAYHADTTGKEITTKLLSAVRARPNIQILEHTAMVDLLVENGRCTGVLACAVDAHAARLPSCALRQTSHDLVPRELREAFSLAFEPVDACPATNFTPFPIRANASLLAAGGIGGLFTSSTNYPQLTGDACLIAGEHGVALKDLDHVQFHPTGLYTGKPGRTFLISESCRGEGAILLNQAGERFTNELAPRDVVSAAIRKQMRQDGTDHVWLSFAPVDRDVILNHFGTIREQCLQELGIDILNEPVPVAPTQHYFMGGIQVDLDGATSMPGLFAAGETACNGVHGANRLASNSLLEAMVWARRAAYRIAHGSSLPAFEPREPLGRPHAPQAAHNSDETHAEPHSQPQALHAPAACSRMTSTSCGHLPQKHTSANSSEE
ncbi:FAD-binding protein [Collinsella sp. AGMB00827]|uniref:L-aspartate oxidase n=1 Tax=Collinsella ureilytica TaxID=2869515 RepID=A0ABS7MMH2_9ACTN|nr:FAD-binding protein [Collinsella urealyticum]MBY4797630.1 FAD-binding protein [Collinsella urealyticum]